MTKILRRRVLIRESDFEKKLRPRALGYEFYDRAEWNPLTRHEMEKENIVATLKGKHPPWLLEDSAQNIFYHVRGHFYNPRYSEWRFNELMGYIWCSTGRSNSVASRMGWAVLEKDMA